MHASVPHHVSLLVYGSHPKSQRLRNQKRAKWRTGSAFEDVKLVLKQYYTLGKHVRNGASTPKAEPVRHLALFVGSSRFSDGQS